MLLIYQAELSIKTCAEKVVKDMIFLSALLRQSIYDTSRIRVGILQDICISLQETFPVITALIVQSNNGQGQRIIPWTQVHSIEQMPLELNVPATEIENYTPRETEMLLRRDLLDKQIVDTQGFRVVKINDLKLAQIKKTARLVGADMSFGGLMRRLGLQPVMRALGHVLPVATMEKTITWNYVEPIQMVTAGATGQLALAGAPPGPGAPGTVAAVQLSVSHNKLADLRPADIADILEQLDVEDAGVVLERLDMETAANTLNEVEEPRQSELLSELDPERASDLLERMAPDDAADILAEMSQQEAERLLSLMPLVDSQPIRELLRYGEETAGGIMTNEVLTLPQDASVEDALTYMRQHSAHLEMVYYLYIVDEQRHLVGVVSLRQLVTAEPAVQMQNLLDRDVIKVQVDTDQEEAARIIAKYDLLALPVVDSENRLCGMITVDDVIDVIHEEQAEDYSEMSGTDIEEVQEEEHFSIRTALSRFSWQAVNALAGLVLAFLLSQMVAPLLFSQPQLAMAQGALTVPTTSATAASLLFLAPMLLLTAGSIGSQSLAIAGWELRTRRGRDFLGLLGRELLHGTMGGILTSLLIALITLLLFQSWLLSVIVGLSAGVTLLIASFAGMVLPKLLQGLRLRGSWITTPLLNPVIAVISLSVFLPVALHLLQQFTDLL